jgi:hypothetical protein
MKVCQTPGAVFHISSHSNWVKVDVVFNRETDLTEEQAALLHDRIHDAMEMALAPLFTEADREV